MHKRLTVVVALLALLIACVGCGQEVTDTSVTTTTSRSTTGSTTGTGKKFSTIGVPSATLPDGSGGQTPSGGGVFTDDIFAAERLSDIASAPISGALATINPLDSAKAVQNGQDLALSVSQNKIADFEKSIAYCESKGGTPDKMVHVSTFTIIGDKVYMTYYANPSSNAEDPTKQEARFAYCPISDTGKMNIQTVMKVGDEVDGELITRVYDTILMNKDENEIYVMWTASTLVQYYRFYRVYNVKTGKMGPVQVNRFKVGDVTNDFSISGVRHALHASGVQCKEMSADIGIMQKLSKRVENGVTYYYTGAYAGAFNCIIKSRDLVTWEYVAQPSFANQSEFENSVYVVGSKVYYFVRQTSSSPYGFLTYYDLTGGKWSAPVLIKDCQSRSDFVYYNNRLFLIHAPKNRSGFGIVEVGLNKLTDTKAIAVADMGSSCFYPYVQMYGETAYISYTVDRQHIRLSTFRLSDYL